VGWAHGLRHSFDKNIMTGRRPLPKFQRTLIYGAVVVVCLALPLFIEWVTTPSPQIKKISIEAFRYGTSPSIIRANRGDRLILTFSTGDTGHSFFLQDYHIDVKISPAGETVAVYNPFRVTEPPMDVQEVRLTAGLPGLWGSLVSVSRFRCHVYCGLMHGFEQGDLIVRPNWLMTGSLGLLAAIIIIGFLRVWWDEFPSPALAAPRPPVDLNRRFGFLDTWLKWRPLQFVFTFPILLCFILVILAGFFGTKVGGRNIAVMLTWAAWMSMLTLLLVPLGGRIWCLICPLPVLGEYLQRGATIQVRAEKGDFFGNHFSRLGRRWPQAWRSPWLRLFLFLGLGTFSASLAGQPQWTAITLLMMAFVPVIMSLVWEGRSFCRFVCPVATYISCYSATGRLMVRKRNAPICRNCKEKPCLRGNAKGWACPYGLSVAALDRNADCGICTECFKSCPYDNVSLSWRRAPWTQPFTSYAESWQAVVLLVLGLTYSLTVHSPWPFMRDLVNVIDKASWTEFGLYAVTLWSLALVFGPMVFWLSTGVGTWLWKKAGGNVPALVEEHYTLSGTVTGPVFIKTMPALIPLGLALWAAFFVDTVLVNFTFILMTFSDPFGWGWNLLGTAGMPWIQLWPSGIPWIQTGLILSGVTISLQKGYSLWNRIVGDKKIALQGFTPTAAVLVILSAGMLLFFTHY
jgi:hypothetical protein